MRFRPCIDLHAGLVKQIVGSTLTSSSSGTPDAPTENFTTKLPAGHFARLYAEHALPGGHVILLDRKEETRTAAFEALGAFPGGMHVGGGVTPESAPAFLDAGASHVIVTSYVFYNGRFDAARAAALRDVTGRDRLVLDLSCRKRDGLYFVCTDRWTQWTDLALTPSSLATLAAFCDEFLVHAVDVEGKRCGVDLELVSLLAAHSPVPVTYAGGARSVADFAAVRDAGRGSVDLTVGSALDLFGGDMRFEEVVAWQREEEARAARARREWEGRR